MNKTNNALVLSILFASSFAAANWLTFDPFFEEHFEEQIDDQIKALQKLKEGHKQMMGCSVTLPSVTMKESDKDHIIEIIVSNIESDSFQAKVSADNKMLTVETDQDKITFEAHGNAISALLHKEEKKENKSDKNQHNFFFASSASSRIMQSFSHPIDFKQQTIEYIADKKQLVIKLPIDEKHQSKSVPVVIVNKKNIDKK